MPVLGGPDDLPGRIEEMASRLESLERRLEALEQTVSPGLAGRSEEQGPEPAAPRVAADSFAFVGRTLLVLAGAYAIRSLTESGVLPQPAGIGFGFAYACVWLAFADRSAGRSQFGSAIFHALAASAVAYPLLWENAAKFGMLAPSTAAAGIATFAGASLVVAWRRNVQALAWIATVGSIAAAAALALSAKSLVPPTAVLLALGAATLRVAHVREWWGTAVVAAAAAVGATALMTLVLLLGNSPRVDQLVHPAALVGLQVLLALVYLGSPLVRTLRSRAETTIGEIALAVPAGLCGVGGAILTERAAGLGAGAIGIVAAVLATGCYAVSFLSLDRRAGGRAGFIFYTSAAIVLAIASFAMLLAGPAIALACCVAAVVTMWIGSRRERATLSLHASLFLATGCATSGLAALSLRALARTPPPAAGEITWAMGAVVAAALAFAALPVASHGRTWGRLSWFPKLLVAALLAFSGCALLITALWGLVADSPGGLGSPAGLAVLRTGILAAAAVALALASRSGVMREAGWLVYPVLIAGGAKLLAEDFPVAPPGALVASFALLGVAIILAPRLGRGRTDS